MFGRKKAYLVFYVYKQCNRKKIIFAKNEAEADYKMCNQMKLLQDWEILSIENVEFIK